MRLYRVAIALAMTVALVALPASLSAQGAVPESPTVPWPPAQTPDGQPDVQGVWSPVGGGTQSLDPAMSSGAFFRELVTGVKESYPSRIVDPADGHIPYQPWAAALQQELEAVYENPTRPEHIDTQTRCLGPGVPRLYYFPRFRILQPTGSVVFVWDQYHSFRVIPLDGRPHIESEHQAMVGGWARSVGGQHAGRGHDQSQCEIAPRCRRRFFQRPSAHPGAIHLHRRHHDELRGDDHRPDRVYPTLDHAGRSEARAGRGVLGVRVSRRRTRRGRNIESDHRFGCREQLAIADASWRIRRSATIRRATSLD